MDDNLETLNSIILDLVKLLPQLKSFISTWHETIISFNVNIITDGSGQLSLDVPSSMEDDAIEACRKKIGVLDSLICDRFENLDSIFKKGYMIEADIKKSDSKFDSRLIEQSKILKELRNSFKH